MPERLTGDALAKLMSKHGDVTASSAKYAEESRFIQQQIDLLQAKYDAEVRRRA